MTRIWFALALCPAVLFLAVAGFFGRRRFVDAMDERHTPATSTAPPVQPTALVRVAPAAELVLATVAADVRALFDEPDPQWWLTEWSPPVGLLQPALIGDAMTVLHPSREAVSP